MLAVTVWLAPDALVVARATAPRPKPSAPTATVILFRFSRICVPFGLEVDVETGELRSGGAGRGFGVRVHVVDDHCVRSVGPDDPVHRRLGVADAGRVGGEVEPDLVVRVG